jgi:hypothetical protein
VDTLFILFLTEYESINPTEDCNLGRSGFHAQTQIKGTSSVVVGVMEHFGANMDGQTHADAGSEY